MAFHICPACERFFKLYKCNYPDECDCPNCQGLCLCYDDKDKEEEEDHDQGNSEV